MKNLYFLLFTFLIQIQLNSQIQKGKLTFEIELTSEETELSSVLELLNGSQMIILFDKDKTRSEVTLGSMLSIATITDSSADVAIVLMDGISGKTALKSSISEMEMILDTTETTPIYLEEYKNILGYNCQKVSLQDVFGEETIFWVTNEIQVLKLGQHYLPDEIQGFPLEFEIINNGLKMKLTATQIEKSLIDIDYDVVFNTYIPKDYKIVSKEQLFQLGF